MIIFSSIEAKRKGGFVSQQRRRENPEFYRNLGCKVRNNIKTPEKSEKLAEFIGVVLGDGGLTKYQLKITLNSEADMEYAVYICDLVSELFSLAVHSYFRAGEKSNTLCISGIGLTEFLLQNGLRLGDKVRNQVDVPDWIKRDKNYSRFCLRGLIDTDGCIFLRKDSLGNEKYQYINLYFSNLSQPLRKFAFDTLKEFEFNPKYYGNKHVRLYSQKETYRYLNVIGSSNYRISRWLG